MARRTLLNSGAPWPPPGRGRVRVLDQQRSCTDGVNTAYGTRGEPDARKRARPDRRAGTGKPTAARPQGVPSPTQHLPMPAEDAASLFQVISRRYQKGSIILTTNRSVAAWGNTSSPTPQSLRPCWTGCCTEASCSPLRVTATGYAPTTPRHENSDRKETPTRLTNTPGVGMLLWLSNRRRGASRVRSQVWYRVASWWLWLRPSSISEIRAGRVSMAWAAWVTVMPASWRRVRRRAQFGVGGGLVKQPVDFSGDVPLQAADDLFRFLPSVSRLVT